MSVQTLERSAAYDEEALAALARVGMAPASWARLKPMATAIHSARGERTFGVLDANANRLAAALRRAGLAPGEGLAIICGNTPEFVETYAGNMRSGFRLTPVNWHLTPDEAAYVVRDCEARALIAHVDFAPAALAAAAENPRLVLKVAIGGPIAGFRNYEDVIGAESAEPPPAPRLGQHMLYTSGTTGRPKGVFKRIPLVHLPQLSGTTKNYDPERDVNLICGPSYHGGPLFNDIIQPLVSGVPMVLMERFDAETFLQLVERHRVTHTHLVSTMFQRLLALPEAVRLRYDVSSLRVVMHGAAPTPPHVKRAMIDWLGPVLWEYYASTEGGGNFVISSQEWLAKPGSVGRLDPAHGALVLNEEGRTCGPDEPGRIFFSNVGAQFEYFNAPEKTKSAFEGETHFTVGDIGHLDADGYLFLTGRTAECIISGGVNIYPQEIDNRLCQHPAVREVCTIGVPNEEWGEEVKSVVALVPDVAPTPELAAELIAFAKEGLAGYKAPRSIDFSDDLPRSEAGKVQRRLVRDRYWSTRERRI